MVRNRGKLRIGILNDSEKTSRYVYEFVQWAKAQENIEVCCLVIHRQAQANSNPLLWKFHALVDAVSRQGLYRAISEVALYVVTYLELLALRMHPRYGNHRKVFDLTELIPIKVEIEPIVSRSGHVYRFSDQDIEKVASIEADLLVRCGSGILKGGILNAARLGVLSFHHGDNRIIRGGPPGFWEVFLRHPTTGFTLQILTEELDGGVVLRRGHIRTRPLYMFNQAYVYEHSNPHLKRLVLEIASTGHLPDAVPAAPYSTRLFRSPTLRETALYCVGVFRDLYRMGLAMLFGRTLRWRVGFVFSDWRDAVLWRGTEIENPPNHYLADPFVITRENRHYCFVEEFSYLTNRGQIAVYELTPSAGVRLGVALAENFHLSFPYLFEYEGGLYMCPECSEAREIRVYRCVDFPLGWALERVIMSGISAVDSIIFEHGGSWWLFTNIDPIESGDHTSELHIFHSHSPVSDKWRPHENNPVIVDASAARNGGLLRDGGRIFRVSQRQGFELYGEAADVNEILELTSETYRECPLVTIRPEFKPRLYGTHHLHSNGSVTVFDYVAQQRRNP